MMAVTMACLLYVGLILAAPKTNANNSSPYHFSVIGILVLTVTIVGLLLLSWWFGYYAWLQLDRYTHKLPAESGPRTYGRMATGVGLLATGFMLSSLLGAVKPFFAGNIGLATAITQLNYYIIVVFPFLGFLWLRVGSRHLAVSAQAVMSLKSKIVTIGPPVLVLAAFYVFLAFTNTAPDTVVLTGGPIGFLALPLNIVLVVGAWVFGLLAALNIERATHRGTGASLVRPLVKLYNGILTMTGGFIILDALLSLGNSRLSVLPVGVLLFLLYAFIGVVALGFWIVARGARELVASVPAKHRPVTET
jgi:hypothetical protein